MRLHPLTYVQQRQSCVSVGYIPMAYSRPTPAAAVSAPVYSASTRCASIQSGGTSIARCTPFSPAMEASTALARDFPSVAALSREDWQTLLTESLDPVEHAEEVRFYEAILHQLPSVRLLYEAYEAQLRRMEQAAGTLHRLMQR